MVFFSSFSCWPSILPVLLVRCASCIAHLTLSMRGPSCYSNATSAYFERPSLDVDLPFASSSFLLHSDRLVLIVFLSYSSSGVFFRSSLWSVASVALPLFTPPSAGSLPICALHVSRSARLFYMLRAPCSIRALRPLSSLLAVSGAFAHLIPRCACLDSLGCFLGMG